MTLRSQISRRRGCRARIGDTLFCTLALLGFADATSAQPSCPQGETLVEFPTGDISPYTVPVGVQALRITAAGSSGGDDEFKGVGGPGAVLTGTFAVAEGDELRVLVGTAGATEPGTMAAGGGGGGSFVGLGATDESAFSADNLLVVAGGGGGSNVEDGGAGGTLDGEGGEGPEPLAGGGGLVDGTGGAGGSGDFGDGGDGGGAVDDGENGSGQTGGGGAGAGGSGGDSGSATGGLAAVLGGIGGTGTSDGGFGGGGGGVDGGGGGGGGFAGGGGSSADTSGDSGGGGGGSSFFADGVTDPSSAATNEGDGFVFFCEISAPPPAFAKGFDPASIPASGISTLTFTIDNSGSEFPAEELAFTDPLPAGVVVADPADASTDCTDGTLTATAGSTEIIYSGGAVEAGAACTIHVDVTSTAPGAHENVSGALTSSLGDSGEAVATLEVSEVAKSFTVETATGTGEATGTIDGGSPGCAVSATALAVGDVTAEPPAGVTLPHGLIALEVTGCEDGASVEVTVSFPPEIPLGSEYWKFGPTQDQEEPHWYTLESASISDSTVTFTLVDGGAGDGDGTVDGTILDPGGPAGVPPVPALPRLALFLLLALLACVASWMLRRCRLDRHLPASRVR